MVQLFGIYKPEVGVTLPGTRDAALCAAFVEKLALCSVIATKDDVSIPVAEVTDNFERG